MYGLKIETTYPNFTLLNCESCHYAGTYGVPDQSPSRCRASSRRRPPSTTLDRNLGRAELRHRPRLARLRRAATAPR